MAGNISYQLHVAMSAPPAEELLASILAPHATGPKFLPYDDSLPEAKVEPAKILRNTDMWLQLFDHYPTLSLGGINVRKKAFQKILDDSDWDTIKNDTQAAADWVKTMGSRLRAQARHISQAISHGTKWANVFKGKLEVGFDPEQMRAWRRTSPTNQEWSVSIDCAGNDESPVTATWADGTSSKVEAVTCEELGMMKSNSESKSKKPHWEGPHNETKGLIEVLTKKSSGEMWVKIFEDGRQICQCREEAFGDAEQTVAAMSSLAKRYANQEIEKVMLRKEKANMLAEWGQPAAARPMKRPASQIAAEDEVDGEAMTDEEGHPAEDEPKPPAMSAPPAPVVKKPESAPPRGKKPKAGTAASSWFDSHVPLSLQEGGEPWWC